MFHINKKDHYRSVQKPILLTLINFNPNMDEQSNAQ